MRTHALVLLLIPFAFATSALADPVRYEFESGFVTLTASVGGVDIGGPVTADLDGIQVTVDEDVPELVSIALRAPGPIHMSLSPDHLGYTSIVISDLGLSGGSGLLAQVGTPAPDVTEYFFLVNPLVANAIVSADGTTPALVEVPGSGGGPGSGSLFIASALNQLSLSGITIGLFEVEGFDAPIELKADFVFSGSPIPEPGAALLFALGFATLALRQRRPHSSFVGD